MLPFTPQTQTCVALANGFGSVWLPAKDFLQRETSALSMCVIVQGKWSSAQAPLSDSWGIPSTPSGQHWTLWKSKMPLKWPLANEYIVTALDSVFLHLQGLSDQSDAVQASQRLLIDCNCVCILHIKSAVVKFAIKLAIQDGASIDFMDVFCFVETNNSAHLIVPRLEAH